MRNLDDFIIVTVMSDDAAIGSAELTTVSAKAFGRYRLLDQLGRGGMGQVFRAYDTQTERTVALKLLAPELADDAEFQRRFRREARAAATLNEPHVVPIHHFGEIDGRLYVDMRLIEGVDLDHLLTRESLGAQRSVELIEQVATALDAAHRQGLVHRDVKPSNILVGARDFAYLIDFGLARTTDATELTTAGQMLGTLAYMAPERFESGAPDARADVYSLTCVLYQCLTGRRPFRGDTLERQLKGHLLTSPPRPSAEHPVLAAFDDVIATGMAKDPGQRFLSAGDLAAAARDALAGAASATGSEPATRPVEPPTVRFGSHPDSASTEADTQHGRWWFIAAATIIVAGLGVGALLWRHSAEVAIADHVRAAVVRYDTVFKNGDLRDLRAMTCGALHDRYQHYTAESWARSHGAAVAAKRYPVEAGIDDLDVHDDVATADVLEFDAATPHDRGVHRFKLRILDGRWKICNDGR